MKQFSDEQKDDAKRRNPLPDLIMRARPDVTLRPAGGHWVALCPFHAERTPSFHVWDDHYTCFGASCGAHGDAITFLMEACGRTYPDALGDLGAGDPDGQEVGYRSRFVPPALVPPRPRHQPAPRIQSWDADARSVVEQAVQWWHRALWSTPLALAYLRRRGIDDALIRRERIGYADGTLARAFAASAQAEGTARRIGLIARGCDERFVDRVILPDTFGGVRYVTGRTVGETRAAWSTGDKYLYPSGVSRPLFGARQALQQPTFINGRAAVFVGEGIFDRYSFEGWGWRAVARGGSYLGDLAREELRSLAERAYLVFVPDNDDNPESERGLMQTIDDLGLGPAQQPLIVRLSGVAKDPGELGARPDGKSVFSGLLSSAVHEAWGHDRLEITTTTSADA